MDILFIIDRLELKYFESNNLVTNFTLIEEFIDRGLNVAITTIDKLSLLQGVAFAGCFVVQKNNKGLFYETEEISKEINDFNLVMFRPDPPVDLDYISATYIFDHGIFGRIFSPDTTLGRRDSLDSR